MLRPTASLALLVAFAMPAAAQAQQARIDVEVMPSAGVPLGGMQRVEGTAAQGDRPVPRQAVILEARRYPFDAEFEALETASTDREGGFEFETRLDRNHEVRVSVPGINARSRPIRTYTFPKTRVTYDNPRPNVVRISMRYTTPDDVMLTAPTLFYVGRRTAKTAPFRTRAKTRRTKRGHFLARASVRIPARYDGRFRFATCFRASGGMGDPRATCPRHSYRFGKR